MRLWILQKPPSGLVETYESARLRAPLDSPLRSRSGAA